MERRLNIQVAGMYRKQVSALSAEAAKGQIIKASEGGLGGREEEHCGQGIDCSCVSVCVHLEAVLTCFELFLFFVFL